MRNFKANYPTDNKMMNIRFCGFGGQGILLSGHIFGTAAVYDGNKVLQTQSYGSESRGGGCRSDVLISGEEIYDLAPPRFNAMVALSQSAYDGYIKYLEEEGTLVIDDGLIPRTSKSPARFFKVKATEIAHKKFGNKIAANMIMIGFTSAVLGSVSKESLENVIRKYVSKGASNVNLQAFAEGYRLGKEQVSR